VNRWPDNVDRGQSLTERTRTAELRTAEHGRDADCTGRRGLLLAQGQRQDDVVL